MSSNKSKSPREAKLEPKTIVRGFILSQFMAGQVGNPLEDDQSLIETGIIDSLDILKLMAFLEEKFKIEIKEQEVIPENFDTVNGIVDLIESKTSAR